MKKTAFFLFIAAALSLPRVDAGEGGLTGYFGWENPPMSEEQKTKEETDGVAKYVAKVRPRVEEAIAHPENFTVPEFAKIVVEARQLALTTMDNRDIENNLKLENISMQRADKYSVAVTLMKLKHPELDITREMPKNRFSRIAEKEIKGKDREEFWRQNMSRIAIVTFVDPSAAENNKAESRVLYLLGLDYPGLDIRILDKTLYANIVKKLGVINFPDTWMIWKGDNGKPEWYRVANGMVAKDQILNGVDLVYQSFIKNGATQ